VGFQALPRAGRREPVLVAVTGLNTAEPTPLTRRQQPRCGRGAVPPADCRELCDSMPADAYGLVPVPPHLTTTVRQSLPCHTSAALSPLHSMTSRVIPQRETGRSARYLQSALWRRACTERIVLRSLVPCARPRLLARLCPAKLPLPPQRSATLWSSSAAHGRLPV
jgi:hypothetical protein